MRAHSMMHLGSYMISVSCKLMNTTRVLRLTLYMEQRLGAQRFKQRLGAGTAWRALQRQLQAGCQGQPPAGSTCKARKPWPRPQHAPTQLLKHYSSEVDRNYLSNLNWILIGKSNLHLERECSSSQHSKLVNGSAINDVVCGCACDL